MMTAYWHLEKIRERLLNGGRVVLTEECLRWVEEAFSLVSPEGPRTGPRQSLVEKRLQELRGILDDRDYTIEKLEDEVEDLQQEVADLKAEISEDTHYEQYGA